MTHTTTPANVLLPAAKTSLPVYGEVECWQLAGLHAGRTLPCTSPRTLLHYLASEGTREALSPSSKVGEFVDIVVAGPVADDGNAMYIRYRMTKEDFHEGLSGSEQGVLTRLLAVFAPDDAPENRNPAVAVRNALVKGFIRL